ncbi:MAG: RidA family protein [Rhodospirillales bacterium]|nr:RidA family protein [Rhodospirillales bacterium]
MAKRIPVTGPGIMEHNQPFPTAVRIGNMVFSSAVGGDDTSDHSLPDNVEDQVAHCFKNVRAIIEGAGGSVDDIAKVTVFLKDRDDRKYVNPLWVEMFPDENDRPVRHAVVSDLVGGRFIQMEFIAVI